MSCELINFEAIRAYNPLVQYCQKLGIELQRNGAAGRMVALCPLHQERTPSFYVYTDDNRFHCFGCGSHGDVTDLEQALGGGTRVEAAARLGAGISSYPLAIRKPKATPDPRPRPNLDDLETCSLRELKRISAMRAIPLEGLRLASERRVLFRCDYPHQGPCYVVTDDSRRNANVRRFDGKRFESIDGKEGPKAKSARGSEASWPIGSSQASGFPSIALCEGAPDFLSAFALAHAGGVESLAMPVCMTSASCSIHKDALPLFREKRVRIFGHADEAGERAIRRWAEQLRDVQAEVDCYSFDGLFKADGSPANDLNEFLLVDRSSGGCPIEALYGAMDFALERRG